MKKKLFAIIIFDFWLVSLDWDSEKFVCFFMAATSFLNANKYAANIKPQNNYLSLPIYKKLYLNS